MDDLRWCRISVCCPRALPATCSKCGLFTQTTHKPQAQTLGTAALFACPHSCPKIHFQARSHEAGPLQAAPCFNNRGTCQAGDPQKYFQLELVTRMPPHQQYSWGHEWAGGAWQVSQATEIVLTTYLRPLGVLVKPVGHVDCCVCQYHFEVHLRYLILCISSEGNGLKNQKKDPPEYIVGI